MTATHSRSRSFLAVAALAASLAAAAIAASLGSSPATAASGEQTIVKTAAQAGQFGTLLTLAKKAGLVGALSGSGPLTVFAPTDAAFKAVPKATLDSLATNRAALRRVLLYHVVKGNVPASRIVTLKSAQDARWPHDRDPSGGQGRLPQPLDEGRQDRHRRDERHDPRHQQGAPATGEMSDSELGGEAASPASPPAPDTPAQRRTPISLDSAHAPKWNQRNLIRAFEHAHLT